MTDKAAMLAGLAHGMFTPRDFGQNTSSNVEVAGAMLRCCYVLLRQLLRLCQLSESALLPPVDPLPPKNGTAREVHAKVSATSEELGCPSGYPIMHHLGAFQDVAV